MTEGEKEKKKENGKQRRIMRLQKPRRASGGACSRPSLSDEFGGEDRSDDSDRTRRNYSYRHYKFLHRYTHHFVFIRSTNKLCISSKKLNIYAKVIKMDLELQVVF